MLIGSRQKLRTFQSTRNLTINGTAIKQISQAKSLGVYVEENLSRTTHINEITKKIASGIGALKPERQWRQRRETLGTRLVTVSHNFFRNLFKNNGVFGLVLLCRER